MGPINLCPFNSTCNIFIVKVLAILILHGWTLPPDWGNLLKQVLQGSLLDSLIKVKFYFSSSWQGICVLCTELN